VPDEVAGYPVSVEVIGKITPRPVSDAAAAVE
jgi:hypothetical protein